MTDLFERPNIGDGERPSSRSALRERRAASKRRRRRRRNSAIVGVSILALVVGGYFLAPWAMELFGFGDAVRFKDYPGPGTGSVNVTIPQGATGYAMGEILVEEGVVASVPAFVEAFTQNSQHRTIQPGTYTFKKEMAAVDAVAILAKGEKAGGSTLTIAEGKTVAQVIHRAEAVTGVPAEEFESALADPASIGLPAGVTNAEGWLFPTTYLLSKDETATSLLSKMVTTTIAKLDEQGVAPELRQTVLIKASIVSAEAPPNEQAKVARVIENRLAKPMPLGMDAIDAYGLGKPASEITRAEFDNGNLPYASRKRTGLPPTPINNPGVEDIKAVLAPAEGPWLWYVTVNLDTGETKFTADYQEFLAFKQEYNTWLDANRSEGATSDDG